VGSGPISKLGTRSFIKKGVELTCVDPLAEFYCELIEEFCPDLKYRPQTGTGESLREMFEPDSFDIVYSLNALDHSYNPLQVIENMVSLIKSDGMVYFVVMENEASFLNYEGMHQWNFYVENRDLMLGNKYVNPINCYKHLKSLGCHVTVMNSEMIVYKDVRNSIHVIINK